MSRLLLLVLVLAVGSAAAADDVKTITGQDVKSKKQREALNGKQVRLVCGLYSNSIQPDNSRKVYSYNTRLFFVVPRGELRPMNRSVGLTIYFSENMVALRNLHEKVQKSGGIVVMQVSGTLKFSPKGLELENAKLEKTGLGKTK